MVGPMAAVSAIDRAKRSVTARYVLPIANACGSTSSNRNLPPLNELGGAMRQAAGERSLARAGEPDEEDDAMQRDDAAVDRSTYHYRSKRCGQAVLMKRIKESRSGCAA
jgi:hypothetical protein